MIDDRRYGGPSQALRLDGYTEAHFIDIPMSPATSNVVEYDERQELNLDGDASVSGTIRWQGVPAIAMRQRWFLLEAAARGKAALGSLPEELQNVTVEVSDRGSGWTHRGAIQRAGHPNPRSRRERTCFAPLTWPAFGWARSGGT